MSYFFVILPFSFEPINIPVKKVPSNGSPFISLFKQNSNYQKPTYSLPLDFGNSSLTLAGLFPLDLSKDLSGVCRCLRSGLFPTLFLGGVFDRLLRVVFPGDCEGLLLVARLGSFARDGLVPRDVGGVLKAFVGLATIIVKPVFGNCWGGWFLFSLYQVGRVRFDVYCTLLFLSGLGCTNHIFLMFGYWFTAL